MVKKTLVIGASLNNDRYSNIAIRKLLKYNIDVEAIGYKSGKINNVIITNNLIKFDNIHTVTLYLNKFRQQDYLLAIGDPIIIGICNIVISDVTNGKFNVLKWEKRESRYYPLEVDFYN